MKQRFLKRVMALALSAALVLPGVPVDVSAQESKDLSAKVSEFAEFVITNPGDRVSAYVGQPLVFYVRAKEAVSFTMSGGAGSEGNASVFNQETGQFKWTPQEDDLGKTYVVHFTATDAVGATAEKDVEISVGTAGSVYKTATLTVSEDVSVHGYNGNSSKNLGILPVLYVNSKKATGHINKPNDGDAFMSLLKFNLGEGFKDEDGKEATVDLRKVISASLELTYVTRQGGVPGDAVDKLRVGVLPNNTWEEGTGAETDVGTNTNWINKTRLMTILNNYTYNEGNTVESEEYSLANSSTIPGWGYFKDNWKSQKKYEFDISGQKVHTDVTKFVKAKAEDSSDKILSLLFNETAGLNSSDNGDAGRTHAFVSREGAGLSEAFNNNQNYVDPFTSASINNLAPSLIVKYEAETVDDGIGGSGFMVLPNNYAETGSDSFVLLGSSDKAEIQLEGNTAGGRITFNKEEQRLNIPAGLSQGAYEMELQSGELKHPFTLYVKGNTTLPTFSSPRSKMEAFVGRELTFYVKANNEEDFGDMISLGINKDDLDVLNDLDPVEANQATFDPATGKFTWTPGFNSGDDTYTLRFYAYDHSRIPVIYTVTIAVSPSAEMQETTKIVPVTADASAFSYSTNRNEKHGADKYLRTNISESGSGVLGEGLTGETKDAKLTFLKFDVSQLAEQMKENNGANLVLTYLSTTSTQSGNGGRDESDITVGIRTAALPFGTEDDFQWSETEEGASDAAPALTWNSWMTWRGTEAGSLKFEAQEENTKSSKIYRIEKSKNVYPELAGNGYVAVGTKIKIDVSDIIKTAVAQYNKEGHDKNNKYLTLLVNNRNGDKLFVSKEGAAVFAETGMNGEPIMAPSIVITEPRKTEVIDGPASIDLLHGYTEMLTNSFTVPGDASKVRVTARGNEDKISWDSSKRQIQIQTGLELGNHPVILYVEGGDTIRRFSIRVKANDTALLQQVLDGTIKAQGRYTDASWANYRYAVRAVETAVADAKVTGEDLATGRRMLQEARQKLITLENALYDEIEKYESVIAKGPSWYTQETLNALQAKVDAAKALLEGEDEFTQAQSDAAIGDMADAAEKLAYASKKNELQDKYDAAVGKHDEEDQHLYTAASWEAYQAELAKADAVLKKDAPSDAEIEEAISTVENAEKLLKTLDDALVEAINEKTANVKNEEFYEEDSWSSYQAVLEAVNGLRGSSYTEARMNQLLTLLQTTIDNMKEVVTPGKPCTCEVTLTGVGNSLSLAPNATVKLNPAVAINSEGCEAEDGDHITDENVQYSFELTEGDVCSVSNEGESKGTVTAGAEEGSALVTVKAVVVAPDGTKREMVKAVLITVKKDTEEPPVGETVTVTFDSDGGTQINAVTIDKGTVVSEPAKPVKDGFDFDGWYADAARTIKYNFAATVENNITLYAKWKAKTQPITPPPAEDPAKVKEGDAVPGTGGSYIVTSVASKTVTLKKGQNKAKITIPGTVNVGTEKYKVVAIGDGAFSGCKKIKQVTINANVTKIGKNAFSKCSNLKKVILKGKKLTVGKKAFKGTAKKATVKWPKGIKAKDKSKIRKALKKQGLKVK